MGQPAAKQGDAVVGIDTHVVLVPSPPGRPTPTSLPHPFSGTLDGALSRDVRIMGKPAAVVGSTATNHPAHVPTPPGNAFQRVPTNRATVVTGSATVLINAKPAARHGDSAMTCSDPEDLRDGTVDCAGTVLIG